MNGQTDPHWIRELTNRPHQFSHESGVEVTHVEPGRAEGILTVGPDSINPHGKVHGGALATLADTVAGCCACARGRRRSSPLPYPPEWPAPRRGPFRGD